MTRSDTAKKQNFHEYELEVNSPDSQSSNSNSATSADGVFIIGESNMALLNLMVMLSSPKPTAIVNDDESALTIFYELIFQLASPAGLMGNLASVVSVADRWRMMPSGETIPELWWVLLLNCFALAFGCTANVVLFLHMQLWLTRNVSLFITAICYLISTAFYMALFGATEYVYFWHSDGNVLRTQAYWHGVIASCQYFLATMCIVIHILYFWGKKVDFEASRRQNMLMRLCIMYSLWIGGGAAVFQAHTVMDISYSNAVYFCLVTCMTLGYGDYIPRNGLSRALSIPFIIGGVLLEGLVTYNVFQSSVTKAATRSVSAAVNIRRRSELEQFLADEKDPNVTDEDSFNAMLLIIKECERRSLITHYFFGAIWLPTFWLVGALVFMATEGWSYFQAFYFCFVSLATVGYGDLAPSSTGGRPFFVYWAFVALPTMAILVSDLTSFVQSLQERTPTFVRKIARFFNNDKHDEKIKEAYHDKLFELAECLPAGTVWDQLVKVIENDNNEEFDYRTWNKVTLALLKSDSLPAHFWLSEDSPIRVPGLDQRRFLLFAASHLLYGGV